MNFFMYGAGNIGRGFIAPMFSQGGYDVVFGDINAALVEALNNSGSYSRIRLSASGEQTDIITNVSAINTTVGADVVDAIVKCDCMATSVGVNILPRIAHNVAEGIALRAKRNPRPINILMCENKVDAAEYFRSLVLKEFIMLNTYGRSQRDYFEHQAGFIPVSVGMMVPVQDASDMMCVRTEDYNKLPVDADALVRPIENVPQIIPTSPFALEIHKKLWLHNMSHCVTAYLGYQVGCEYINQAIKIPEVFDTAKAACYEVCDALAKKYDYPDEKLKVYADELLTRYANPRLMDTVARVGGDVKRKLSPDDRLVGPLSLVKQFGGNPKPFYKAIAAGLKFAPDEFTKTPPAQILGEVCQLSQSEIDFILSLM